MDKFAPERIDADLVEVEARLREGVPRATALELDRIKLRAMAAQASHGRSTQRSDFMRSRIAVAMMLVCGFLLSGTGAGLAVSGISGSGSAAEAEYPPETTTTADQTTTAGPTAGEQQILGQQGGGTQGRQGGNEQGGSTQGTAADQEPVEAAQPAEQVAVTGGDNGLPFTGFAAIPLLLLGVGLVAAGFVIRHGRMVSD